MKLRLKLHLTTNWRSCWMPRSPCGKEVAITKIANKTKIRPPWEDRLWDFNKSDLREGFQVKVSANVTDHLLTKPERSDQGLFLQQIVGRPEWQSVWMKCERDYLGFLGSIGTTWFLGFISVPLWLYKSSLHSIICSPFLSGHNDSLLMKQWKYWETVLPFRPRLLDEMVETEGKNCNIGRNSNCGCVHCIEGGPCRGQPSGSIWPFNLPRTLSCIRHLPSKTL